MFCDTCHWYTRGEAICPHCGAPQGPTQAEEIASLPEEPAPAPEVPVPLPEPPPAPLPTPAPLPAPVSAPKPVPAPVPVPAPKPAPTPSGGNKQGFKALALILAGTVVLILVLLFAEMTREDTYYTNTPDYDDSYFQMTEPIQWLWDAQPGDEVYYGDGYWRVLERNADVLLLLAEYEIYMPPEEIDDYLAENGMFQFSPEELEHYGIEPPEVWDDETIPVRPAIWVNV